MEPESGDLRAEGHWETKITGRWVDPDDIVLDPNNTFESLLIPLIELQRKKSADYATEDDAFINFRRNASMMDLRGYDALEDCLSMVARKFGRIVNLRGRAAANETVIDSYEDLAVYALLALGLAKEAAHGYGYSLPE